MSIRTKSIIESFTRILPTACVNKVDNLIKERRTKAIEYLKSLNTEFITESEVEKAFDIDLGRV